MLAAAGCSAGQAGTRAAGTVLRVNEWDFGIKAPKHVTAGDYRLSVKNKGPDAHELIVVREQSGQLPLRPDGVTVDEELLEPDTLGTLEPGEPGDPGGLRDLEVHLAPGRYVLFCNMSGHYLGGMHANLVVR